MGLIGADRRTVIGAGVALGVLILAAGLAFLSRGAPEETGSGKVAVDSFGSAGYSLARWPIDDSRTAGWIDTVTVEPGEGRQVTGDDQSLVVTGWAGETTLVVRTPYVVLTLCDTVVGAAPVDRPRPDVAEKVHPNLEHSGWRARLLVGHLPRCIGTFLEAWAVWPSGSVLLPLDNRFRVDLPPRAPATVLDGFQPRLALVPGAVEAGRPVTVELPGPAVLYRGPDGTAREVGRVQAGRYSALKVDERNGWVLWVIDGKGGWLKPESFRIAG